MSRWPDKSAEQQEKLLRSRLRLERAIDRVFRHGTLLTIRTSVWHHLVRLPENPESEVPEPEDDAGNSVPGHCDSDVETGGPPDLPISEENSTLRPKRRNYLTIPDHLRDLQEWLMNFERIRHKTGVYPFHAIVGSYFVNRMQADDMHRELINLRAEFDAVVRKWVRRYPTFRKQWRKKYPSLPEDAYPDVSAMKSGCKLTITSFNMTLPDCSELDWLANRGGTATARKTQQEYRERLTAEYDGMYDSLRRLVRSIVETGRDKFRRPLTRLCEIAYRHDLAIHLHGLRLRKRIREFRLLNFVGDSRFAERLDELERVFNARHDFRVSGPAHDELKAAAEAALVLIGDAADIDRVTDSYLEE